MGRATEAFGIVQYCTFPTEYKILQSMNDSAIFSKLDLKWGNHQSELTPEPWGITTVTVHNGIYRYKRLISEMCLHAVRIISFLECGVTLNLPKMTKQHWQGNMYGNTTVTERSWTYDGEPETTEVRSFVGLRGYSSRFMLPYSSRGHLDTCLKKWLLSLRLEQNDEWTHKGLSCCKS